MLINFVLVRKHSPYHRKHIKCEAGEPYGSPKRKDKGQRGTSRESKTSIKRIRSLSPAKNQRIGMPSRLQFVTPYPTYPEGRSSIVFTRSVRREEGEAEARAGKGGWVDIDMQDRLTAPWEGFDFNSEAVNHSKVHFWACG